MKTTLFLLSTCLLMTCSPQQNLNSEISADEFINIANRQNFNVNPEDFPIGTNYSESAIAIQGAYNQFVNKLKKNDAIRIVAEVNHSANAKRVGLDLEYTRIVFFGNPNLGTPLMQTNQLAGLDLPQHVLFYKNNTSDDLIIYNSASYLSARYDLIGVPTLDQISNALESLVSSVSNNPVIASSNQNIGYEVGIITKESTRNFDATYATLRNAISSNPNLTIVAELDHQANAMSVGLTLRPTKIIIFGNPNLGTPLMQSEQTFGLDLPQKMLVWEDENGITNVSYNDINFLVERHGVTNNAEIVNQIEMALNQLSNVAAGL